MKTREEINRQALKLALTYKRCVGKHPPATLERIHAQIRALTWVVDDGVTWNQASELATVLVEDVEEQLK